MTKTETFIIKAANKQGKGVYDYSEVEYITNRTKVKILCSIHGGFLQAPDNHLRGRGCPTCSKEKRKKALQKPKQEVLNKLRTNEFEYPDFVYKGARSKIIVKCKTCNNIHTPTWDNHINKKRACKFCSGSGKRTIQELLQVVNTDLYSYPYITEEYKYQRSKITIVCNRCTNTVKKRYDLFKNDPYCALCDNRHHTFTADEAFSYLPHDEYEFPLFFDEYYNAHSKLTVVHKKCNHIFDMGFKYLTTNPRTCSKCYPYDQRWSMKELFTRLDTDNFTYPNIEKEYKSAHSTIMVCCTTCTNISKITLRTHIKNRFCKVCHSSVGERSIIEVFSRYGLKLNEQYTREFKVKPYKYRYDFHIDNYLIEFDGKQHFEEDNTWAGQGSRTLQEIQKRDQEKNKIAKDKGYVLVRIPYYHLSKLEFIMVEQVLKPLGYV